MKLYIKQKVFSWKDRFNVYDDAGNEKFYVEGEIFSFGKKLHVYYGKDEVCFIQQRLLTFMPKYNVYVGKNQPVEIVKNFTFFRHAYTVESLDWDIEGDFFAHEYVITKGGATIATVHKEWFTWGDCYAIDIPNPADELYVLCAVLVIDCIMAQAAASASSN